MERNLGMTVRKAVKKRGCYSIVYLQHDHAFCVSIHIYIYAYYYSLIISKAHFNSLSPGYIFGLDLRLSSAYS
jgi:hypothetical protein